MSFKYLFNNNFTDNRLLQKMPNYEAEAQMFQEQQELERQKQQQQIDQISQQGMTARGLSPETIGVSPQKSTKPNIDWSDPVAVNRLYHGDYGVIQGNNRSPAASITTNTTPTFDPNAGKDDLYNQQLNAYLKEYFSNRGYSKRRDRKAREYFDRMFNYDWNANVGKRKSAFESEQLALQKQQEEQRQLDKQIEEQDARARKLEEQGHIFNGTDWVLDPSKVTFSGFDGNMQTWGNRLQKVFNANKDNKVWGEIAGDDAVITQDELKAWQQKKGLQVDGKLGFNTLQAMGFGDQRNTYDWMKPVKPTQPAQPLQPTSHLVIPAWQTPEFIAEVNAKKNNTSSNQGASAQTSSTATQTSSVPSNQGTYAQPEISNSNLVGAESYRNEHTMRHAFNKIFNNQVNGKYTLNGNLIDDVAIQRDPNYQKSWENFKAQYKDNGSGFMKGFFSWILDDRYTKRNKNGGTINKYKQGNKMNNEQELQKAFMAYLIEDAAAQGVQIQSEQDLQAYAQQLGEEGLKVKYQEFMQKMQGQSVKAALGAKLNYIRKIKGMCPDGEETYFFKEGGSIKSGCKPCMAKAQKGQELKTKGNAIQDFKNKRKHINESDTVHTKYGIRDLNGNTKYPKWNPKKENYTTQERQRVVEKDWDSGKKIKVEACGGKAKKKK